MRTSTIFSFVLLIVFFLSCKKEVNEVVVEPLDTNIEYLSVRSGISTNYSILDSSSNTFYVVFDTANFGNELDEEPLLFINTSGDLSLPEESSFDTGNITEFSIGDGLGKTDDYKVVPLITSVKGVETYCFDTYSSDSLTIERNKRIEIPTLSDMFLRSGYSTTIYDTYFSPVFEDQISNSEDDITFDFFTNDNELLIIDNDSLNYRNNMTLIYMTIENVPREPGERLSFFEQTMIPVSGYNYLWKFIASDSDIANVRNEFLGEITNCVYNPLLETISFKLEYDLISNLETTTTRGLVIKSNIEVKNFLIRNTQY